MVAGQTVEQGKERILIQFESSVTECTDMSTVIRKLGKCKIPLELLKVLYTTNFIV